MTQASPVDIAREISRRREPRLSAVEMAMEGASPNPQACASIGLKASEYEGKGSFIAVGCAVPAVTRG
jgi:hypothetical protein